jgi:hypothetical protein
MGNALAFVGGQNGLVPAFGFESGGIIDRKASIVADFNALAMIDVFVGEVAPFPRKIDLGGDGFDTEAQRRKGTEQDGFVFFHKTGMLRQKWKNGKHPDV